MCCNTLNVICLSKRGHQSIFQEFDVLEIIGTNQPQMKRPESEVEFVPEDRMSLDDLDDQDM